MKKTLTTLGDLRSMLITMALICMVAIPFTSDEVRMEGVGLFTDVLAPVVSLILVFVILLDMLMSRVFMIEKEADVVARFKFILKIEFLVLACLIGFWAPYFVRVIS